MKPSYESQFGEYHTFDIGKVRSATHWKFISLRGNVLAGMRNKTPIGIRNAIQS